MSNQDWIKIKLNWTEEQVNVLFKNTLVFDFLIIWSYFEGNCSNSITLKRIRNSKIIDSKKEELRKILTIFLNLHKRYQDDTNWKNLIHKDNCEFFSNLRGRKANDLELTEKIRFVFYVIYRFRNNIFHGNKGVQSWLLYEEQINQCIEGMKILNDFFENSILSFQIA